MKTKSWWIVLGAVAVAIALGLAWQRLQTRPLLVELEVLRDRQRDRARLQAQRERLLAAPLPEAEVRRLRDDRAAIARMRREVDGLRAKVEEKERAATKAVVAKAVAAPARRFAMGVDMPSAQWRNTGAATPAAALETVLWAAAGGDLEALAARIRLDGVARTAALELLQALPADLRAKCSTPEQLMAFLSIKDIPIGTATVTTWSQQSDSLQSAVVNLRAADGSNRRPFLVFVREGEEWKLRATEAAVARYAAALRGQPVASGKK